MKKSLPYIIVAIVLLVVIIFAISSKRTEPKKLVEHITMRQFDRIPYGTSATRELLPSLFPGAAIYYDDKKPGNWDSVQYTSYNQAVVLMSSEFGADEEELRRLLFFARQGNFVFIIARSFSDAAENFFNFSYNNYAYADYLDPNRDSLVLQLETPLFDSARVYTYPGKKFESVFQTLDTGHTAVLGRNEDGYPNFIEFSSGAGKIFIHSAPLAFSNYFVLHKNNKNYFQQALSVIPVEVDRVLWNEYYLKRRMSDEEQRDPNWFRVLLRYDSFRWGLMLACILMGIFLLLGLRRRQRKIPPYARPTNDTLDFVKTMGRLYHDRRDHLNLARKMSVYFLEHVRTHYKMSTQVLDEQFTNILHQKTGYGQEDLQAIISFINYLGHNPSVTEAELTRFHKKLELFYQNT